MMPSSFQNNLRFLVAAAVAVAAPGAMAQSKTAPASAPPSAAFDVADVHMSPYVRFPFMEGGDLAGDRYILHQANMTEIIAAAYKLDPSNVQGGPSWLDWDHFDIIAVAPPTTSKAMIRLMLQSLLAQRFNLVVHTGSAPMPAYVLSAPKGKTKLKESDGNGDPNCEYQPPPANQAAGAISQIVFTCHNETMEKFAQDVHEWAGGYLTKPVVDSTGLTGAYDFDLKWTGRGQLDRAGHDGISIFDAVDKELGLKLALETAPRPVLIVDSVNESPTPNPPDLDKRMPPLLPPQIEVATIKPSKPDESQMFRIHGDQINGQAISLKEYIQFAWDLNFNDNESLAGSPKWLGDDRIDIMAKLATDDSGGATPKTPQVLQQELQQMLRGFIEDRFKMKDHWENRPVTAYNLVAVSPKLAKADPKSRTHCNEGPGPDGKDPRLANPVLNRLLTCQNLTMAQFGVLLQSLAPGFIFSPVIDDTGLKSAYDFTLSFSSADHFAPSGDGGAQSSNGASQPSDPNGAISLFDAVKNQLGLKLEKQKRPVPVLVIDHIEEQPTPN